MSNDVMIPEDLGGGPAALYQEQNVQVDRLGDGIEGSGFPVIGVNGKEFYLRYKGKRHTLVNPPSTPPTQYDGMPAGYFDFVVLRKGERRAHTYYKGGYQKGMDDRPTCVSTDGIAPDDNAVEKQADLCDLCPRHEWKRQPNGRDGRECADSLRLAVVPMPSQMIAVLGHAVAEPCLFRVPAASLTALAELGDMMTKRFGGNTPYCSYILRVTFKQGVEWPQFEYRVVRFLKDAEPATILELREQPQAYRILGLTPEGRSLVRRGTVQLGAQYTHTIPEQAQLPIGAPPQQQFPQQVAAPNNTPESAIAEKLAAERAARIAAVRAQVIDVKAEVVAPPPKTMTEQVAQQVVIPESTADIDALVAAMRPRAPGA